MAITQKFLDWQQPALQSAAEYLLTANRQENLLALDHVIVVVPGRLAGRRLQEILLERTQAEQLGFLPPQIVTVGRLPELLYEARQPFANDLEQRLAWVAAIKACDPQVRAKVFPHLPEGDQPEQWLHYGSLLWHLHRELAGDAHDDRVAGNDGALFDKGAPGDDAVRADHGAVHDRRVDADQAVVADGAAVDRTVMGD